MRVALSGMLLLSACASPTEVPSEVVEVRMVRGVVEGATKSVITVTNNRSEPILIGGCAVWIESQQQAEWEIAYSPSCVGGFYAVQPGESQTRRYPFLGGGTYRPVAVYRLTEEGENVVVRGPSIDW